MSNSFDMQVQKLIAKLNSIEESPINDALSKSAMLVEGAAKKNAPVDEGFMRNSIFSKTYNTTKTAEVICPTEYAPYVEYGTGLFAEAGDGRKDVPWRYQDEKGNWHTTSGQHPQPFMRPALYENQQKIVKIFKNEIKKGLQQK